MWSTVVTQGVRHDQYLIQIDQTAMIELYDYLESHVSVHDLEPHRLMMAIRAEIPHCDSCRRVRVADFGAWCEPCATGYRTDLAAVTKERKAS